MSTVNLSVSLTVFLHYLFKIEFIYLFKRHLTINWPLFIPSAKILIVKSSQRKRDRLNFMLISGLFR